MIKGRDQMAGGVGAPEVLMILKIGCSGSEGEQTLGGSEVKCVAI